MTESCKYAGSDRPRMLVDRHVDECQGSCGGCLPCPASHCRVDGVTHAEGTCPECRASTRDDLHEIGKMCGGLSDEVKHRGINGEAMVLLLPVADPEARGHLEASILAGRVPSDYLEVADDERHPLTVLGTWLMVWQDALEHEDDSPVTIASAIDYLDRQLTYMAGYPHVPFEDFVTALQGCRAHLASVLHDEERGVTANVPCFDCGSVLERQLGKAGFDDHWTCRRVRCHRRYTIAEYNFALRASLEAATEDVSA